MTSSPIADLSYRGYDGPLEKPHFRWSRGSPVFGEGGTAHAPA